MARTSLSKRKPPKLATPQPTSSITRVFFAHAMSGKVCMKGFLFNVISGIDISLFSNLAIKAVHWSLKGAVIHDDKRQWIII